MPRATINELEKQLFLARLDRDNQKICLRWETEKCEELRQFAILAIRENNQLRIDILSRRGWLRKLWDLIMRKGVK